MENGKYGSRILDPATTVDGSKSYIRLMPIDTTIQLHFPNIFYLGWKLIKPFLLEEITSWEVLCFCSFSACFRNRLPFNQSHCLEHLRVNFLCTFNLPVSNITLVGNYLNYWTLLFSLFRFWVVFVLLCLDYHNHDYAHNLKCLDFSFGTISQWNGPNLRWDPLELFEEVKS